MGTRQRQILALTILGIVWVGLLIWQWSAMTEEPVRVPLVNVTGQKSAASPSRAPADGLQVRLDLLSSARTQRELTFTTPRNIFALPVAAAGVGPSQNQSADVGAQQQLAASELAQFHYLGFVRTGDDGDKKQDLAVLTKNDDLHVVKKGQTVENHVVVKAITEDSVTLLDRDTRVEHTVLLSEEPVVPQQ